MTQLLTFSNTVYTGCDWHDNATKPKITHYNNYICTNLIKINLIWFQNLKIMFIWTLRDRFVKQGKLVWHCNPIKSTDGSGKFCVWFADNVHIIQTRPDHFHKDKCRGYYNIFSHSMRSCHIRSQKEVISNTRLMLCEFRSKMYGCHELLCFEAMLSWHVSKPLMRYCCYSNEQLSSEYDWHKMFTVITVL